ncbi:MAG: serine/threonine protein kinase [Planctomycetes bacterium]|nr:serine/threonine protein kinase [Planctomycetota bacterium]
MRQEFGRAREAFTKTGKADFSEAETTIEALRALDENNGHVWYYKGEIKRISNPDRFTSKSSRKASSGPFEGLHEYQQDFLRYLEIASSLPESETGGAMGSEICYERPKGFCVQRTAWIHHLLAIDFYEEAMASVEPSDRAAKLTRATAHAKEARRYRRPEGGEGFDQGIDTTALQMKIVDAETKASRRSSPATGHVSGRAHSGSRKSALPLQDLSRDALIANAPRIESDGQTLPALGGIPLWAKLGQGGMGAVYYGIHPRLHKEVAVKVLPFHLAQQRPEMVDRFFREAQMAARVQSPHLVGVTDVNEEAGLSYLVMEFVPGVSAGAYLKEKVDLGKVGIAETLALDICIAATTGLAAAHAAGIVHRDVKPDNILIPKAGEALNFAASKLADLGLARSEELGHSMTGSQACMGTPGYMSPEHALDASNCGKPADVFSMGATLYALLAGKPPFTASTLMKVLMATRNEAHLPIGSIRADLSASTAALIDRCLSKNPQQRLADGTALLSALTACRHSIQEPPETIQVAKRRESS